MSKPECSLPWHHRGVGSTPRTPRPCSSSNHDREAHGLLPVPSQVIFGPAWGPALLSQKASCVSKESFHNLLVGVGPSSPCPNQIGGGGSILFLKSDHDALLPAPTLLAPCLPPPLTERLHEPGSRLVLGRSRQGLPSVALPSSPSSRAPHKATFVKPKPGQDPPSSEPAKPYWLPGHSSIYLPGQGSVLLKKVEVSLQVGKL